MTLQEPSALPDRVRRVRWGYLVVVLYILAFIAYKIAAFLVHRAKLRPRRI